MKSSVNAVQAQSPRHWSGPGSIVSSTIVVSGSDSCNMRVRGCGRPSSTWMVFWLGPQFPRRLRGRRRTFRVRAAGSLTSAPTESRLPALPTFMRVGVSAGRKPRPSTLASSWLPPRRGKRRGESPRVVILATADEESATRGEHPGASSAAREESCAGGGPR